MGFEKWLHISGEIQPGTPPSVLTYLVETKVVNMWIYEENIIWIRCSLRGIKYVGKSDPVATVKKVKKLNYFGAEIKNLKVGNKG